MALTFLSSDQLKKAANTALASVPSDHSSALVGTIDSTGAQIIVAFRRKDSGWSATFDARHEWTGDNAVGASLIYSF